MYMDTCRLESGEDASTSDQTTDAKVTSKLKYRKPKAGDKFVNKYRILEELGKGSFAEVYLCEEEDTGIKYAMKMMARPTKKFRDEIEEIAIMKTLKHPNIVDLKEVIDDPSKSLKIYIVQVRAE
jgi:serine/threonine protein kinase